MVNIPSICVSPVRKTNPAGNEMEGFLLGCFFRSTERYFKC